ncbi:hypothetical protein ACSVDE_08955 [Pseudalkalibacillus sp. Hm43]|uniref:hypothetical protein n=1 Tax=Pseudalkalibacillus sp. Hm43 TaxID=3450742 RepID=UPI003F43B789
MKDVMVLIVILLIISLPIWIGMIRSRFNSNSFYGDELNKKKNKRTLRDESYEKTSSASKGENFYNS